MPDQPVPMPRTILCPYCGATSGDSTRCPSCGGRFDPLSRQATQNAMGPWFVRDPSAPFRPGCSFETLRGMVLRGKIGPDTIIRGPTTRQFWELARRTPGVANLLGLCHNCQREAAPNDYSCKACGAVFTPETDRQHLGLSEVRLLPGHASPERIAIASYPEDQRTDPPAGNGHGGESPAQHPTPHGGALALLVAATVALGAAGGLWVSWPPDRLIAAVGGAGTGSDEPVPALAAAVPDGVPPVIEPAPVEPAAPEPKPVGIAEAAETTPTPSPTANEPGIQAEPEQLSADLPDRLAGLQPLRRLP